MGVTTCLTLQGGRSHLLSRFLPAPTFPTLPRDTSRPMETSQPSPPTPGPPAPPPPRPCPQPQGPGNEAALCDPGGAPLRTTTWESTGVRGSE